MGTVLANGSMSSNTSNEGEIRKNIINANLVDCMVALPSQLFFNTMIPACLWFLRRGKKKKETLFIDARNMGEMISRRNRALTDDEILKIADTYHAWRGEKTENQKFGEYNDIPGFCKSASREEIEKQDFVLTPGRYVGIPEEKDDGIPFEDKMNELTARLAGQIKESNRLDKEIKKNLESIGFKI
jgi:type I restriction enzyme M protein